MRNVRPLSISRKTTSLQQQKVTPVVYVLDGEYYFSFTTEAAALLAQSQLAPNCIVVEVTTNNRERDFSPPVDAGSGQTSDQASAGGAIHFLII
ncbi:MAG: hypothetical protein WDO15_06705 [Bacteroidota bacterium]